MHCIKREWDAKNRTRKRKDKYEERVQKKRKGVSEFIKEKRWERQRVRKRVLNMLDRLAYLVEGAKSVVLSGDPLSIASVAAAVGIGLIGLFLYRQMNLGEEPVARVLAEYKKGMGIQDGPLFTPEGYLDEITGLLEVAFVDLLPDGHSWEELAKAVISSFHSEMTDITTLSYIHSLLLQGGLDGNPVKAAALQILHLWGVAS